MNERDIINIARIKLPIAIEVINKANLEAQKSKPNIAKLHGLLYSDEFDGFYDVFDLISSYIRAKRINDKYKAERKES